jgi:hypothetical protein
LSAEASISAGCSAQGIQEGFAVVDFGKADERLQQLVAWPVCDFGHRGTSFQRTIAGVWPAKLLKPLATADHMRQGRQTIGCGALKPEQGQDPIQEAGSAE